MKDRLKDIKSEKAQAERDRKRTQNMKRIDDTHMYTSNRQKKRDGQKRSRDGHLHKTARETDSNREQEDRDRERALISPTIINLNTIEIRIEPPKTEISENN